MRENSGHILKGAAAHEQDFNRSGCLSGFHQGSTPLHWAASHGQTECLATLLNAGAAEVWQGICLSLPAVGLAILAQDVQDQAGSRPGVNL